jgi:hypothetical protein
VPLNSGPSDDEQRSARALVAEVVLRMIDWMGEHKTTWESASGAWDMLYTLLPLETKLCVFSRVKAILVKHLDGRLMKIEVCPCGYTVYHNCTSAEFGGRAYQNAHRTQCPRKQCGLSRYLPGTRQARKVGAQLQPCLHGSYRVVAVATAFSTVPTVLHTFTGDVLPGNTRVAKGHV